LNIDKKYILGAAGILLGVMAVVAAVFLFTGIRQFGESESKLATAVKEMEQYYRRKPFPSPDNIRVLDAQKQSVAEWIQQVTDILKLKRIAQESLQRSPSKFVNLYGDKSAALRRSARECGVVLKSDTFGFERYTETGSLPAPEEVPRLTEQLAAIEVISRAIFEEKIRELLEVRREEFETGASRGGSAQATTRSGRAVRSSQSSAGPTAGFIPVFQLPGEWRNAAAGQSDAADAVYRKYRFLFRFMATESAIAGLMNRLTQSDLFVVVTALDVVASFTDAPSPVRDTGTRTGDFPFRGLAAGAAQPPAQQDTAPAKLVQALGRRARMVFGPELEKPSEVTLQVDVYLFDQLGN